MVSDADVGSVLSILESHDRRVGIGQAEILRDGARAVDEQRDRCESDRERCRFAVERHLHPLTDRSRDNLPNPRMRSDEAYVPANMPALSDLFDMFDFDHAVKQPFLE